MKAEQTQKKQIVQKGLHKGFLTWGIKKQIPWQTGTFALCKIHKYQESTELPIRKLTFAMLKWEITLNQMADIHSTVLAISALQEAAEIYLADLLKMPACAPYMARG